MVDVDMMMNISVFGFFRSMQNRDQRKENRIKIRVQLEMTSEEMNEKVRLLEKKFVK